MAGNPVSMFNRVMIQVSKEGPAVAIMTANSNTSSTTLPIVYIIDNDEPTLRALMRLMRSAGYASLAFSSVGEFLRSNLGNQKACVIADVHMPGISALELPGRLHAIGAELPVIFLTADYSDDTRENIRRAGGRGYFGKPVDDHALLDMIRWTTTRRD